MPDPSVAPDPRPAPPSTSADFVHESVNSRPVALGLFPDTVNPRRAGDLALGDLVTCYGARAVYGTFAGKYSGGAEIHRLGGERTNGGSPVRYVSGPSDGGLVPLHVRPIRYDFVPVGSRLPLHLRTPGDMVFVDLASYGGDNAATRYASAPTVPGLPFELERLFVVLQTVGVVSVRVLDVATGILDGLDVGFSSRLARHRSPLY